MNKSLRERLITSTAASILFSFTLFFLGPSYLYFTNITEFLYLYSNIWYVFLIISVISSLILTAILATLKGKVYEKAVTILFALGVLLWIQGNVIIWNYGPLDGREIIWKDHIFKGLIDLFIWISIVVIVLIKTPFVYKLIKKASIFLIAIQLGGLLLTAYMVPKQPEWKNYSIDTSSMFELSSDKNVIVFVLDTFQSDVFQEIIADEEYRDIFDGFTYFRNAVGGYPTTYGSIPFMLTGKHYDNSIPMQDFIKKSYLSDSLPYILKQKGFEVHLYPSVPKTIFISEKTASNIVYNKVKNKKEAIININRLSAFRCLPNFLKKYFHDTSRDMASTSSMIPDIEFFNRVSELYKSNSKPIFKFYHLRGAHAPFSLNENLEHVEMKQDRMGYITQSKASLKIVEGFLNNLKKIGTFNNSMIFILGDHGMSFGEYGINNRLLGFNSDNIEVNAVPTSIIASSIPLVLAKPFNADEKMNISDAPVSLGDIPKTVTSELNIETELTGKSMFEVKESEVRKRRFLHYFWEHEYWDSEYLPPLKEFIIEGFSWFNSSWHPTYKEFTDKGIIDVTPPVYQFGSIMTFGTKGSYEVYTKEGWSNPEKGFTWTYGKKSCMYIPIEQTDKNLQLNVSAFPFLAQDKINMQRVNISVNGHTADEWNFIANGIQEKSLIIPNSALEDEHLDILFELPDAVSPDELGVSGDTRTLGLAFRTLVIEEVEPYKYGDEVMFMQGGNSQRYIGEGWHGAEKEHTWTDSKATLSIPINKPESDILLKANIKYNLLPDQKVNIMVNGEGIGEWILEKRGEYEKSIIIPNELVKDPILEISFEIPKAISPKKLGMSEDGRTLGMALKSITLEEQSQ